VTFKTFIVVASIFALYLTLLRFRSHLFVKIPQPGDSEVTYSVFKSSSYLLLPVYPLKGRGILVKCLDQGHNKQT